MLSGLSSASVGILVVTTVAAVSSGGIFLFTRRREETPGSRAFSLFALSIAAWNGFAVVTHLAPNRPTVLVFHTAGSIASLVVAFLWFEFTVSYTGYGDLLTRPRRALLWLHPVAFTINETVQLLQPAVRASADVRRYQGLWFVVESIDGPLGLLWAVVPVVLTLVGFALLARFVLRTRGGYRKQALAVLSGALVSFLVVTAYLATGVGFVQGFDPTPMGNALMALIVGVALFRWNFLDVAPLATDLLFEEMADPVFVVASSGLVADANEAARTLAGTDPEGEHLASALPELEAGLADAGGTVTLESERGRERIFDLNVSPLFDPYDRQRGRLLVLRDVTAQVERERELQRQNERLDRFASVVSHDLRNPLNVAYGFAEQTRQSGDLEYLDRSLSAMEDMERLIDDLLTLAREGQTVDETEWLDLSAVAEDAWPFLSEDPTLSVESTGQIEADRERLSELLGNCFRNAHDHGPTDVTVRVGLTDDGFYVEDDGPGIPADEREAVFESGYTTGADGTGLGLQIVADIAEAHGWSITVEGGRDGGARFVVSGARVRDPVTTDRPLSNSG